MKTRLALAALLAVPVPLLADDEGGNPIYGIEGGDPFAAAREQAELRAAEKEAREEAERKKAAVKGPTVVVPVEGAAPTKSAPKPSVKPAAKPGKSDPPKKDQPAAAKDPCAVATGDLKESGDGTTMEAVGKSLLKPGVTAGAAAGDIAKCLYEDEEERKVVEEYLSKGPEMERHVFIQNFWRSFPGTSDDTAKEWRDKALIAMAAGAKPEELATKLSPKMKATFKDICGADAAEPAAPGEDPCVVTDGSGQAVTDGSGNKVLAGACSHAAAIASAHGDAEKKAAVEAVGAAAKPEDGKAAACKNVKAASVLTATSSKKLALVGSVPSPGDKKAEGEKEGGSFLEKHGKTIAVTAGGAAAGLLVAAALGLGPMGLLVAALVGGGIGYAAMSRAADSPAPAAATAGDNTDSDDSDG